MSHKIVVDANVWIRFARSRNIHPLTERFVLYDILPYANNYLLSEVFDALVENNWADAKTALKIIDFIERVCEISAESAVYRISPDNKDNYLFDLAIQNNCEFIVSDDLNLVSFILKPVPVVTSNRFIKNFPI